MQATFDSLHPYIQWAFRRRVILLHRLAFGLLASFILPCFAAAQANSAQADTEVYSKYSQIRQIDHLVEKVWNEFELKPSPAATDGEWCRRVHLDILGRVPTNDELDAFVKSKQKNKQLKLVETLLHDDKYTEELARNWTTLWTNLLIGRTGGTGRNSMINRAGMQKFLRDSFARNKPYDKIATQLITATGTTTPGDEKFNGATNYLIDKVNNENGTLATASASRLFLGLQVQCTQCHNHPFNDWKQNSFWEMNAFFRQTRAFPGGMRRGDAGAATLADQDYRGESNNIDEADLFYELRNGIVKVAFPVFVDGTEIKKSGYVNVTNRRQEFSNLMVDSPFFSRVLVNRMWAHFLGYGFTNPVDDLGPHNIPTNPELLDYLASEFKSNDYDLRQLITWVSLSKAYSLSSKRTSNNESDDPLLGNTPKFSHFYLRQMRAEELYESLLAATQAGTEGNYEQREAMKNRWLQQFSQAFGTDEGDETTTFNGTIPQVLMMFNGELIRSTTGNRPGNLIDRLVNDERLKDKDRIDYLFKAGLSRRPTRKELKLANDLLKARSGDKTAALQDVWWVILNTNEFIFNH